MRQGRVEQGAMVHQFVLLLDTHGVEHRDLLETISKTRILSDDRVRRIFDALFSFASFSSAEF